MAAQGRATTLQATLTSVQLARATQLVGTLAGQVSVRATQLIATQNATAKARAASLSGLVAGAAGAPVISPPGALDVSSAAAIKFSASATFTPPAVAATWRWRIVARDAGATLPVFDDATKASPLMSVPPSLTTYHFTVGVVVTDSLGRPSGEATIPVTVHRADYMSGKGGSWSTPTMLTWGTPNGWG